MPETTPAVEHVAPASHAEHQGDVASAHGAAHHAPFSIDAAMMHHNMPYPAWEPVHGTPLITFDLGTYAAMNLSDLRQDPAFATADGSRFTGWAEEVAAHKGFRYPHGLDSADIAKAMTVAETKSLATFPKALSWFNQQIFFGTLALLLLVAVVCVFFRRKPDQVKPENKVQSALESIVIYFRDNIVEPNFHGHGSAWTPFFVSTFLIILSANLIGLIPGTGTLTGNIGVTAGFALVTFVAMLYFGMKEQGPRFWINLVPIRFTWAMSPVWVLLFVIEAAGLGIRAFALCIRLFANMFAGHTVLLVFLSLGYIVIAQASDAQGTALALGGTGFILSIAFYAMELLVAFIQAYVFTLLSAMFIGSAIHPSH